MKKETAEFNTSVARVMFAAKRAIPDIHKTVVVLSMKDKEPNETEFQNLIRTIKYLVGKNKKYFDMNANDLKLFKWYVDISLAVHPDFKSHTRVIINIGQEAMQSASSK